MRIGIICEGKADRAVLTNILIGLTGIDSSDLEPLRPIDKYDETDKANLNPSTFGGWGAVKDECVSRKVINEFLSIEGQDFIVIQLDSAEAEEYEVKRPDKRSENFNSEMRELIIQKMITWMKEDLSEKLLYAITIEEIDAWVLTIYDKKDSSRSPNPKKRLAYILAKNQLDTTSDYDNYLKLTKSFSKLREFKKQNFQQYNESLNHFLLEVNQKLIPKL